MKKHVVFYADLLLRVFVLYAVGGWIGSWLGFWAGVAVSVIYMFVRAVVTSLEEAEAAAQQPAEFADYGSIPGMIKLRASKAITIDSNGRTVNMERGDAIEIKVKEDCDMVTLRFASTEHGGLSDNEILDAEEI
jgi:hypothetical protein